MDKEKKRQERKRSRTKTEKKKKKKKLPFSKEGSKFRKERRPAEEEHCVYVCVHVHV